MAAKKRKRKTIRLRPVHLLGCVWRLASELRTGGHVGGWPPVYPSASGVAVAGDPAIVVRSIARLACFPDCERQSTRPRAARVALTTHPHTVRAEDKIGEFAAEIPVPTEQQTLIPQAHGGALLAGGVRRHRGGTGRPKEELRVKMRELLAQTLEAMQAAVEGERLAGDALRRLVNDERIAALPEDVRETIAVAARDHLTARLSNRELVQYQDALARYSVGTQQQVERTEKQVRYIVRLPVRAPQ